MRKGIYSTSYQNRLLVNNFTCIVLQKKKKKTQGTEGPLEIKAYFT